MQELSNLNISEFQITFFHSHRQRVAAFALLFPWKWLISFCHWSSLHLNLKCQGTVSLQAVIRQGFEKVPSEVRNSHDPQHLNAFTHAALPGLQVEGWKVCVGVSVRLCGWMMISAVLLSNQQLLIHLTEQINKAGHSWSVCVCVRA